ncbi:unnamed protein product [Ilex paraguariensis]|uniref:Uncharacterized protein n=1 Tax=Ilex paraguariensis TaxID=185542 RepID=A0ABC8S1H1_9AQUA
MSSHCTTTFLLRFSGTNRGSVSCSPANQPSKLFAGFWSCGAKASRQDYKFRLKNGRWPFICAEYIDVIPNGFVEDDIEGKSLKTVSTPNNIKEHVDSIRSMLASMDDGEISVSAYDTAWVALVEDIKGSGVPQFPTTLQGKWHSPH